MMSVPTEDRPVHLVHDCVAGETTYTPMTDEEMAEKAASDAALQAAVTQQEAEDAALSAAVAAHPDPIVKELARRLGI